MLSHLFYDRRRTRKNFCPENSFLTMFPEPLFALKELTINPLHQVKLSIRSISYDDAITITIHVILLQARRETSDLWPTIIEMTEARLMGGEDPTSLIHPPNSFKIQQFIKRVLTSVTRLSVGKSFDRGWFMNYFYFFFKWISGKPRKFMNNFGCFHILSFNGRGRT